MKKSKQKITEKKETFGVKSVAKSLGVSRATILRWVSAGKIEGFFRIGHKWLIREVDLDNFIDKKIISSSEDSK